MIIMAKKSLVLYLTASAIFAFVASFTVNAENWQQWRGSYFNGSTTEKELPTNWSKTENIVWVAKMPGPGPSTAIIWGDRVFISAAENDSRKLWAICLNRINGQELWRHEVGIGPEDRNGNNGAVPSPVTDGEHVYFFYATGDMIAYDMDGNIIWRRNIVKDHGRFQISFHYGASPLLYKDKIYLAVIHRHTSIEQEPDQPEPMSYLLCIDPKTGEDIWKFERKTDAFDESMEAYTTPYPFEGNDGLQIILVGADYVTSHDPSDGKEIWRWGNLNPQGRGNFRVVPMVVSVDNIVIFCEPRGGAMFAMDGNQKGQLSEKSLLWKITENAPDVATPLVMDGKLFVLDGRRRILTSLNPKTGEVYWRDRIDTNQGFQASPTGADGKIYCISMGGEVAVLSAGDKFELLSKIDMGEGLCRATIAVSQGQLFVRTSENLYCIGK